MKGCIKIPQTGWNLKKNKGGWWKFIPIRTSSRDCFKLRIFYILYFKLENNGFICQLLHLRNFRQSDKLWFWRTEKIFNLGVWPWVFLRWIGSVQKIQRRTFQTFQLVTLPEAIRCFAWQWPLALRLIEQNRLETALKGDHSTDNVLSNVVAETPLQDSNLVV